MANRRLVAGTSPVDLLRGGLGRRVASRARSENRVPVEVVMSEIPLQAGTPDAASRRGRRRAGQHHGSRAAWRRPDECRAVIEAHRVKSGQRTRDRSPAKTTEPDQQRHWQGDGRPHRGQPPNRSAGDEGRVRSAKTAKAEDRGEREKEDERESETRSRGEHMSVHG